jgi:uncharacterized protein (TIGR02246 family)
MKTAIATGEFALRLSAFCGLSLLIVSIAAVESNADEAAVKSMINEYANAFNAKSLDEVMQFWSKSGVHIDRETGQRTEGQDAIRADIAEAFEQRPKSRMLGRIESLRFITPEVASVQGRVTVSIPGEDPSLTDFSAILVGKDGKWKIEMIEEMPVPIPATSYEALRELEWLVGSWSDQSAEARVKNVFRWSASNAFLIRSFSVETSDGGIRQGTQVIGWDPRSQEIRSWTFNSNGSFGDATWSRNGEDWLIKSSQTLGDGQAASGTFVLSRTGDDEMTMKLIGHEIEGEPQPTKGSVTVVRQSAEPSEASSDAIKP